MAVAAARKVLPDLLRGVCKDEAWVQGDDLVERWQKLLARPVPKSIKYGKALQRILGKPATLGMIVEYRDTSIFLDDEFSATIRSPLDPEDWRVMQAANRLVALVLRTDMDRVPSRDEIQQNIQATKGSKKSPDVGSVSQACKLAFVALGETLEPAAAAAIADRANALDEKELIAAWTSMAQAHPGFLDACTSRNAPPAEAWTAVPEGARRPLVEALQPRDAAGWVQVDQMNSYSRISSNIPTGVMSRIENMATKLAGELQTGSVTMETLNLQQIGEQVLSTCDASDLTQLSGNLGELLPVLSNMAPGVMPQMSQMPQMPPTNCPRP